MILFQVPTQAANHLESSPGSSLAMEVGHQAILYGALLALAFRFAQRWFVLARRQARRQKVRRATFLSPLSFPFPPLSFTLLALCAVSGRGYRHDVEAGCVHGASAVWGEHSAMGVLPGVRKGEKRLRFALSAPFEKRTQRGEIFWVYVV